jgi:capsular polysaccharide biosynthesis protein
MFLLPVILVPLLVIRLTGSDSEYSSTASVWVSSPVADAAPALGHRNPYLTPAQNQASALNDLLATHTFRENVVKTAGIVDPSASAGDIRRAANDMTVHTTTSGVNLLAITAKDDRAEDARAIAAAVISEYQGRATSEIQRDTSVSTAYYKEQVEASKQTLASRQAEVSQYLASNPRAADPRNPESQDLNYLTLIERVNSQAATVEELEAALERVTIQGAAAPQTQEAAFSIQDTPSLPSSPEPVPLTKRVGYPLAGLFFGLLIGCTFVYFSYRTDHTIRTAADLTRIEVPLLGSVPDLRPGPAWMMWPPVSWMLRWRKRDFARRTAASISVARSGTEA